MGSRRRVVNRVTSRSRFLEDHKANSESRALEKYQTRDYKPGDIYAPHDLSPLEMRKWGKRQSPKTDAFDALNLNPLDMYKVGLLKALEM
jgi:small subunit ribosomal protein S18